MGQQLWYIHAVEFKGLDLIDTVSDELWTEVCDIVQETGIKTNPKKKKWKKVKCLSEEALQIAVKRRSEKQSRKGKTHPFECRVSKNSKDQGRGSLVGCRLWGRTESDMTEAT